MGNLYFPCGALLFPSHDHQLWLILLSRRIFNNAFAKDGYYRAFELCNILTKGRKYCIIEVLEIMFFDFERDGSRIMKVFVSWSGELSKKYAAFLKTWLEQCIQSVEVFFSAEDIEKGETWHAKLSSELRDTDFGIICLTSENVNAPWIHFEAGALSKMLDSRVATIAININFSEIKGPLNTFQATKLEKEDIYQLLTSINKSQEKPLSEEKLIASFEAFWPNFEKHISETRTIPKITKDEKRGSSSKVSSESIEEILQLVRNQSAIMSDPRKILPIEYLALAMRNQTDKSVDDILGEIYKFTRYVFFNEAQENIPIAFVDAYTMLIKKISFEFPVWRRRFSLLLNRQNSIYNENIGDK